MAAMQLWTFIAVDAAQFRFGGRQRKLSEDQATHVAVSARPVTCWATREEAMRAAELHWEDSLRHETADRLGREPIPETLSWTVDAGDKDGSVFAEPTAVFYKVYPIAVEGGSLVQA